MHPSYRVVMEDDLLSGIFFTSCSVVIVAPVDSSSEMMEMHHLPLLLLLSFLDIDIELDGLTGFDLILQEKSNNVEESS